MNLKETGCEDVNWIRVMAGSCEKRWQIILPAERVRYVQGRWL
jgi:hypothetical protein